KLIARPTSHVANCKTIPPIVVLRPPASRTPHYTTAECFTDDRGCSLFCSHRAGCGGWCGRRRAAEPAVLPHRWPGSRLPLVGPFWSRRVGPSPALAVKVHTHHTLEAAYPDPVLLAVQLHREMRTLHRSVECGKHSGLQVVPRL